MDNETLDLINRIANEHCKKTFGYLDEDDLKNEIWIICLDRLDEYDDSRGNLEHFLRVTVKNRLINKFKDITKSVRSPCPRCPFFKPHEDPDCGMFGHIKTDCEKWKNYCLSVQSRNALLNPTEEEKERETGNSFLDKMVGAELINTINENIDEQYRRDFEEFVNQGRLPKQRLKKLIDEIKSIISFYYKEEV